VVADNNVPTWRSAVSGQAPQAAQVNQMLASHPSQILYAGTSIASVTTSGSASTGTNGTYIAQSFTMSGTSIGLVQGPISTTTTSGANLPVTTLSLYASSGSAPTGTALVSTTITAEYAYATTSNGNTNVFTTYPLPIAGLTNGATYWLVLAAANSGSNQYTWFRSASASGASTSPNGTTWTAQAYGLRFNVFDQSTVGNLVHTWEDSGARWTATTYNSLGLVSTYSEYVAGQTATNYLQGVRTFNYTTANQLTTVT
jgi:hypothetical protein